MATQVRTVLTQARDLRETIRLLKLSYEVLKIFVEDCGKCDHTVGICVCEENRFLEDVANHLILMGENVDDRNSNH